MLIATALIAALLSNPFAAKPAQPAAAPAAAAPAGQPAAQVPDVPPRGFPAYAHPEVTPDMCKVIDPGHSQCTIPAMTAGRYMVEATGTSTAVDQPAPPPPPAGAAKPAKPQGPVQKLIIFAGTHQCMAAQTGQPWTGAHTIRVNCEISVVADQPFIVTVLYGDLNATKDPRGPSVVVHRLPWDGLISAQGTVPNQ